MKSIDAPETALLLGRTVKGLTEQEAKAMERDLARVSRQYGRAVARVRKCKASLREAQTIVRELRRSMRLLISARKV